MTANQNPTHAHAPITPASPAAGDFAALDAMSVDQRESALAKMTPWQVAAYLESAPGGLRDNPRGRTLSRPGNTL